MASVQVWASIAGRRSAMLGPDVPGVRADVGKGHPTPKISQRFWPGVQAGAYLSSYFVNGRGRKAAITENVCAGDLPRLVVFVGRDLTIRTGCTMRALRHARRLWASREGLTAPPRLTLDEWLASAAMLTRHRVE
jgi:hypothetical protein